MREIPAPLNIDFLVPTEAQLRRLRPVTSLDIFDGPGGNFHDDGLFSTTTFGRVGDPERMKRFGYIPLGLPIIHPLLYTRLIRLKSLYRDIISGQEQARFNPETGDFERCNDLEGDTGYAFFFRHWHEFRPPRTGSSTRDLRIDLIDRMRDKAFLNNFLVIPAGLRDADIEPDGRVDMDDINELYQRAMMIARNLPQRVKAEELASYDRSRYALTLRLVEITDYLENMLSGKKGFIQRYWASRRVFNATRNVLSSMDPSVPDLSQPNRPSFNDTQVGIHQLAKAVLPKTLYYLRTGLVGTVFDTASNTVSLVHPTTYEAVRVEVSNEELDRWRTPEGLEGIVNELGNLEQRSEPVMVEGHYLALVYTDDQQQFRICRSITELPEDRPASWLRPITYIELVYLAGYRQWNQHGGFVTRYPVENMLSSYPTTAYVKTTMVGDMRWELDEEWQRRGDDYVALEYPRFNPKGQTSYYDATAVNPSKLEPLGADFDGDTVSFLATYTTESMQECQAHLRSRQAYLKAGGGLAFSVKIQTLDLALRFITGEPQDAT